MIIFQLRRFWPPGDLLRPRYGKCNGPEIFGAASYEGESSRQMRVQVSLRGR
jgi:hypothetical protein